MFKYYIAKATESFGVVAAREIYERAIEALPDKDVRPMCLKYAELERKLGEIDRARAIYGYASQFFDPKVQKKETLLVQATNGTNVLYLFTDTTCILADMA